MPCSSLPYIMCVLLASAISLGRTAEALAERLANQFPPPPLATAPRLNFVAAYAKDPQVEFICGVSIVLQQLLPDGSVPEA